MMNDTTARNNLKERLTVSETALVIIDVQNDFCAKDGYFDRTGADLGLVEPAVSQMLELIAAARSASVKTIYVKSHYDPVYLSRTQNERRKRVGWDIPLCRQGTWGVEFYRVSPEPDDVVVIKHRYDSFFNTDLELILRSNDVRNLVLAGVATNVCVESTLRSAFFRDFEVVLAEDCCAARTMPAHNATLENVRRHFGIVAKNSEIFEFWRAPAASSAVPA